jgi:hypothetical protein
MERRLVADAPSRCRRLLVIATGVSLLALVFTAALEVVARLLITAAPVALTVSRELSFDPVAGWRGRRGFEGTVHHGQHPAPIGVSINADGFRDASWDAKLERAARTRARKVLVLGDSLVYGWSTPADGRLTEELQVLSAERGRLMEVFNAGIPSYGPAHQARLLPELLARLHPDDVIVVFCGNDYGDTALPYDHRYPDRVYQPFYDTRGDLLFNARVPRRPSLTMRDGMLGGLRLWRVLDLLDALVRDARYARHGIPNARTPGVQIQLLDDLFYDEPLQRRLPYVEETVLALYRRMAERSRAVGARFAFLPSIERVPPRWVTVDSRMRQKIESRGVTYLSPPLELSTYSRWIGTWRDGHPNFVWAWALAARVFAALEGRPLDARFTGIPQLAALATRVDLREPVSISRSIGHGWGDVADGGRRLEGLATVMLRHPDPGHGVVLHVIGRADRDTTLVVSTPEVPEACRLALGPEERVETCPLRGPADREIVFVALETAGAARVTVARVEALAAGQAH